MVIQVHEITDINIAYSYLYGDIQGSRSSLCDQDSIDRYYRFLESDFDSSHIIEGLLQQLRRYGFLHLCSEEIFSEGLNVGQPKISRTNFDEVHEGSLLCSDYWWRGYSPLIEKYLPDGAHDQEQMRFDWESYGNLTTVPHVKNL